ncbi:MAG: hypothetical protein [Inoviridae sp.]|nr:MAG: hypothetical protein [Inoviridae sp.]
MSNICVFLSKVNDHIVITDASNDSLSRCSGFILLDSDSYNKIFSHNSLFTPQAAFSLFGACASLYALVFIFKLARKSFGI